MASAHSDIDSDDEQFVAAVKQVEEAVAVHKKPQKAASTTLAKKREKLSTLASEGVINKTQTFIKKANKTVIEKNVRRV
jgi:hypothetical protein